MNPIYAGRLCDDLTRSLRGSEVNLSGLANNLTVVLREEAWRERRIRTGQIVTHQRFIDFITTPPLEGLGEDPDRIKKLLRDDLAALAAFETAISGEHGGDRKSEQARQIKPDNIRLDPEYGTDRAYTLRRLAKHHPKLFEQVTAGELSAHKAAIVAGFRKPPTILALLQRLWEKASPEDRQTFLRWVEMP